MRIKLLEEIMDEICNEFNINIKKQREDQKSTYEKESSPIQVDTPTGLKLQIGRNMRQNDLISFKFSKKGDLWFHAQESTGSHVVLKSSSLAATKISSTGNSLLLILRLTMFTMLFLLTFLEITINP